MNRPFLLYQIEILAKAGIRDIVLSLSYQPDKIEDLLGDGSDLGVRLSYVTESSPLGTGGAYRNAADALQETTVVLNGDILTNVDLSGVIRFHRERGSEATLSLVPVPDPSAYGLVETDEDRRILRFLEKPKPEEAAGLKCNTINAGIYVLETSILDLIAEGENRSFEYDVFPAILAGKKPFYGYILEDTYWRDLGNPASYLDAHRDFIAGRIEGFDVGRSDDSEVATTAAVDKGSLVGQGAVVKPGARVVNSVIGPGAHIEEKAVIEDSVIWAHARVSAAAEVRGAIIGRSGFVGRNAHVGAGTVLGDKASIPDYSQI
jgi:NDP-sugar pyrophosphorylase family protein